MKIVVTGASGYIGSFLCKHLINSGHDVIAIARKFSEETANYLDSCTLIESDVISEHFTKLNLKADMLIHLASANDIVSRNVTDGLNLSVIGTKNALDLCLDNRINKFIFFSTIQVYGSELTGEVGHRRVIKPENDYALNHYFAEQYVEMYSRKGLLNAITVRPTNVYGRLATSTVNRWTLVPLCFCQEVVRKKRITLKSSGQQIRNFISLYEVSLATEAIINKFPTGYDEINIASKHYLRIVDVAAIVKQVYYELYSEAIEIKIEGSEPQQPNYFNVSLDKLQHEYSCFFDKADSLAKEIKETFILLEKNKELQ